MANESEISFTFIQDYLKRNIYTDKFIKQLCHSWSRIWRYIDDNELPDKTKFSLKIDILNYADIDDLKKIEENSSMKEFIISQPNFLSLFQKEEKTVAIIKLFEIKFTNIELENATPSIIDFIYVHNSYAINPVMLEKMIRKYGQFNKNDFLTGNYGAIKNANTIQLSQFIDANINDYVENVYVQIDENKKEQYPYLIELLNKTHLTGTSKKNILIHTDTLIEALNELDDWELFEETILKYKKLSPTWRNIKTIWQKTGEFSTLLVDYLNDMSIAQLLGTKTFSSEDEDGFQSVFLSCTDINDDVFPYYLESFPNNETLNFNSLSYSKVEELIEKRKLTFSANNFEKIKDKHAPLHLTFLVKNIKKFLNDFSDFYITEDELIEIFKSEKLNNIDKLNLAEAFDQSYNITRGELYTKIGRILLTHLKSIVINPPSLSEELITNTLLQSSLKSDERIKLFLKYKHQCIVNTTVIEDLLIALGGNFAKLIEKGPRPFFSNTKENLEFLQYLKNENIISSLSVNGDKITVATFRK